MDVCFSVHVQLIPVYVWPICVPSNPVYSKRSVVGVAWINEGGILRFGTASG